MQDKLHENIKNWLGYGTEDVKIWFLGMEEGGAEISDWPGKIKEEGRAWSNLTLKESLNRRAKFDQFMDFNEVWKDIYNVDYKNVNGSTVWRFMAAFHLAEQNKLNGKILKNSFLNFLENDISKYRLIELFPLPCPSKTPKEWNDIYNNEDSILKDSYNGRKDYQHSLISHRLKTIFEAIKSDKKLRYTIDYGAKSEKLFRLYKNNELIFNQYFSSITRHEIKEIKSKTLYQVDLIEKITNRKITIIETPFFGNGQMSYRAMQELVAFISKN